ncbi:DUF2017 family protein [Compostimonas suwonensis]|uniref:Uncharacterized protein DUF2017 n=1 Tax=Compostimonas suwonensis TaxID=1048394 RepID=A0A2M9BU23_9MICO|nr:DUF2017 family protein [Compostimonas suwonensis]PJJ61456.1 uncharacterized protein DUF2017 [Compostimonas suwonensis]
MKAFEQDAAGALVAEFEPQEALILTLLATDIADLLDDPARSERGPVLERLLPDAYPDDDSASAEFRRLTAEGLATRKRLNAHTIISTIQVASIDRDGGGPVLSPDNPAPVRVELDEETTQAWLKSLNDIRLTIGVRLGLDDGHDAHDDSGIDEETLMRDIYRWVSDVQDSLLEALDA